MGGSLAIKMKMLTGVMRTDANSLFTFGLRHVDGLASARDGVGGLRGPLIDDEVARDQIGQCGTTSSHHGEREERIVEFQTINTYHVSMVPYFLNKLKNTPDGEGTLLDNTLVLYGSPMGDSNLHNHKRVPLFLAGRAGGALKGNIHVRTPDGTPTANAMLTVLHKLGVDLPEFGDSTGEIDLTTPPVETTAASKA